MRVTRAQAEANRERVIKTAGELFRERGFDGVGLNDLMQTAGLTRGGFYGQFQSKLDLTVQALNWALSDKMERWRPLENEVPERALDIFVKHYLSGQHRKNPGDGCALAALAVDTARQPDEVRRVFTDNLDALLDLIAGFCAGDDEAARRQQAMAIFSTLVGGLLLSRATSDTDLADALCQAAAQAARSIGSGD